MQDSFLPNLFSGYFAFANNNPQCIEKDYAMESMDARKKALEQWLLTDCGLPSATLQAMFGDASFRRYFRIYGVEGSFIAMDAPHGENCVPYVAIANALRRMGLSQSSLTPCFAVTDARFSGVTSLKAISGIRKHSRMS